MKTLILASLMMVSITGQAGCDLNSVYKKVISLIPYKKIVSKKEKLHQALLDGREMFGFKEGHFTEVEEYMDVFNLFNKNVQSITNAHFHEKSVELIGSLEHLRFVTLVTDQLAAFEKRYRHSEDEILFFQNLVNNLYRLHHEKPPASKLIRTWRNNSLVLNAYILTQLLDMDTELQIIHTLSEIPSYALEFKASDKKDTLSRSLTRYMKHTETDAFIYFPELMEENKSHALFKIYHGKRIFVDSQVMMSYLLQPKGFELSKSPLLYQTPVKHEFSHSMFNKTMGHQKKSLFYPSLKVMPTIDKSQLTIGAYQGYILFEEFFNFTQHPFWNSAFFHNMEMLTFENYQVLLSRVHKDLMDLEKILNEGEPYLYNVMRHFSAYLQGAEFFPLAVYKEKGMWFINTVVDGHLEFKAPILDEEHIKALNHSYSGNGKRIKLPNIQLRKDIAEAFFLDSLNLLNNMELTLKRTQTLLENDIFSEKYALIIQDAFIRKDFDRVKAQGQYFRQKLRKLSKKIGPRIKDSEVISDTY